MIESVQNQQIKYIKKLKSNRKFRNAEELYLIEGSKWLREALMLTHAIKTIYFTEEWQIRENNNTLLNQSDTPKFKVSESVMKAISDMATPPGVIALAHQLKASFPDTPSFLLILDNISDPGNLGSMIRTAAAASVDALILSPNCVDVYNPKVVRSSMGTLLKIPTVQASWSEIKSLTTGIPLYGLDAQGDLMYTAVDWQSPAGLMVGNESNGLSDEGRSLLKQTIAIPMAQDVESLNASMAAGIVIFEAFRQKQGY